MEEPLIPELLEYGQQFRAHRAQAEQQFGDLTVEPFNWRPEPGRWSVAECLLHLNEVARDYMRHIRVATDRARRRGLLAAGPSRYGMLSRWFLRTMDAAGKRRFRAPGRFVPPASAGRKPADVLREFQAVGREWEECLRLANGLDLRRVKIPSPVTSLLRFPLGAVFGIMAAHERRHLWQALQVRQSKGFPAAGEAGGETPE